MQNCKGEDIGPAHVRIELNGFQALKGMKDFAEDEDFKKAMEAFWAEKVAKMRSLEKQEEIHIFRVIKPNVATESRSMVHQDFAQVEAWQPERLSGRGASVPDCQGLQGLEVGGPLWHCSQVAEGTQGDTGSEEISEVISSIVVPVSGILDSKLFDDDRMNSSVPVALSQCGRFRPS